MTPKTRTWLRRLPLLGVALLLTACAEEKQDVFHPEGTYADKINTLQVPVFIAAGVVGVLVAIGLVYVIVSGRRRGKQDVDPAQIHGNTRLEVTWTIIPAVILVIVAIPTVTTMLDISKEEPDALTVEVYGQQWWWSYEYDVDSDGTADIITANELVIPVGRPVNLEVHSRDVIHSFWIPDIGGARDAVPGRAQPLQVEASNAGVYYGQCKEYCGLSHANMRALAVALEPADYDRWVEENMEDAGTPDDGTEAAAGLALFTQKCASCHQVDGLNEVEGKAALVAGTAPNLTHLMDRLVFASAMFQLWVPDAEGNLVFNRNQLEAWLRDPEALIPMAPDEARGMPNLALTEEEIDKLVAYLETLGPYPDNAIPPGS